MSTRKLPTVTIRGHAAADLLSLPPLMLGFHPSESCVVLGFEDNQVIFCARLDLDLLALHGVETVNQVLRSRDNFPGARFVLLGYSAHPQDATDALLDMEALLGERARIVVTDNKNYWEFDEFGEESTIPVPYAFDESVVAAQGVYQGLNISACREQVVAAVGPPLASDAEDIAGRLRQARTSLASLDTEARLRRLQDLVEASDPLTPDEAAELVALLQMPDHVGEVLSQLTTFSAASIRTRLQEARQHCDRESSIPVLGLLGMACWLDGQGVLQSECMSQLAVLAPSDALLMLLERVHSLAIPPARWDEA